MSLREGIGLTPGGFPYRQAPHQYCGSNSDRQSVGDPGHCEDCCSVGHIIAHPDLGCGDVGCYHVHADKPITYAGPTGREKPGEHWNARLIRETREAEQVAARRSDLSVDQSTPYRLSPHGVLARRLPMCVRPACRPGCWVVLSATGNRSHFYGQHLTDQHVAAWSPLVRKGGASA